MTLCYSRFLDLEKKQWQTKSELFVNMNINFLKKNNFVQSTETQFWHPVLTFTNEKEEVAATLVFSHGFDQQPEQQKKKHTTHQYPWQQIWGALLHNCQFFKDTTYGKW